MKRCKYILKTVGVCSLILAGTLPVRAQGVAMEWVKQMNSNGDNSMGMGITHDTAGNVYITGRFGGTVDFDPGPNTFNMVADGISDIFVTKLTAAGNLVWAKKMGSPSNETDQGVSIAVDAQGNVYTTGIYGGVADFDPGAGTALLPYMGGWSDIFISKLDASGNFVWAKSIGGTEADAGSSLTLDGAGNLFLSGAFSGTVDFDPGNGAAIMTAAEVAGFVCKLDTAGNFAWAKQFSGAGNFLSANVAAGPSGNIYLMGSVLDNTVDLDPGTGIFNITPMGFIDGCIIKLNSSGNFIWGKQMGGIFSMNFGIKLALDDHENVLSTGAYLGSVDFDPGTGSFDLSSTGSEDLYFSKLDSAGNFIWAKSAGGTGAAVAEPYAFTTDSKGNVYASGFMSNTVDFDPGAGTANLTALGTDAFMVKLDSAGNYKWAKQIAGTGAANARGISVDASGHVYTTGDFTDTCDFDPNTGITSLMSTPGKPAVFVHKMVCSDTSSSVMTIDAGCEGYVFNGNTYTQTGVYHITMPNEDGCDSTITLNLQVAGFTVAINASGFVLTAAQPYTTYQWIRNGSAISGATSNTYTVTENGQYRLAGTNASGCKDTSDIYSVTDYTGIDDISNMAAQIHIYPNPATDMVFVDAPVKVNLVVTDIAGKTVLQQEAANQFSVKGLSSGVYFLRVMDKNNHCITTEKLVKER